MRGGSISPIELSVRTQGLDSTANIIGVSAHEECMYKGMYHNMMEVCKVHVNK